MSSSADDGYTYYNADNHQFTQFEDSGAPSLPRVRENYYDGDGGKIYYQTYNGSLVNGSYTQTRNYYLIRSSALGGAIVAEYNDFFASSVTDSFDLRHTADYDALTTLDQAQAEEQITHAEEFLTMTENLLNM